MAAPQTKLKITGIGILSRFHIMHYRNKDVGIEIRGILEKDRPVDLTTGIEIIPNLKIRFANKEDSDILTPFNPSLNSIIHCSLNQYVLESTFEVEDNPETSAETQRHIMHIINRTVQALRLFKAGYVDANTILWISERNTDKQTSLYSEMHSSNSLSEYSLATHEITELSKLVAKTLKIDLLDTMLSSLVELLEEKGILTQEEYEKRIMEKTYTE